MPHFKPYQPRYRVDYYTDTGVRAKIDAMLKRYCSQDEIAERLNAEGYLTIGKKRFDQPMISRLMKRYDLKAPE